MRILSVNRAAVAVVGVGGEAVPTAIGKRPVEGRVRVGPLGLEGDEQADVERHGGRGKALYAYPREHYRFWRTVRAQARVAGWDDPLADGSLGENLTIDGMTEDAMWIGDRLVLPDCVLAFSAPRFPCEKLNATLGFPHAAKLMLQSGYCGGYLAVIEGGSIAAGDPVVVEPGRREVNLRELFRSRVGA
jgi:MOSC domain-containing protein YiiM